MARRPEEYTERELREIGKRVVQYWNQFGPHDSVPGADTVERLSRIIEIEVPLMDDY